VRLTINPTNGRTGDLPTVWKAITALASRPKPWERLNPNKQVCTRGFYTVCGSNPPPSVRGTSWSDTGR
jgi:hypothetical protein